MALPEKLTCPSCGDAIPISTLLTAELQRRIAQRQQHAIDAEMEIREGELRREREAVEAVRMQLRDSLKKADKARAETICLQQQIEDERLRIQSEAEERVLNETQQIRAQERARAERETEKCLTAHNREMKVLEQRLREAEGAELRIRTEAASLKAREDAVELEIMRRVDVLRDSLSQELAIQAQNAASIEVQRRDLEISRLREKIAALNVSPGPTELIGETFEQFAKSTIVEMCPVDDVLDVPRGMSGGDLIHVVRNPAGAEQGKILWEFKRTRSFDLKWIAKLKNAQQNAGCDIAVIVTATMPRDVKHLGLCDQVWVCSADSISGMALLLRHVLLRVSTVKTLAETKDARLAALHSYLSSTQFRLATEAMVSHIKELERQLESEQRAMTRAWQRRRQVTLEMSQGLVGLLGSLEGALRCELVPSLDFEVAQGTEDADNPNGSLP
jgi:hypothetical protein